MATKGFSMRKIVEILRLRAAGLSFEHIAQACGVSKGAASQYVARATAAGLSWPLPEEMSHTTLRQRLGLGRRAAAVYVQPDFARIHQELKRPGVTRELLWEEYRAAHPPGRCYQYSPFCEHYRQWCQQLKRSMRQTHVAGEKCFLDYCGPTVPIVDRQTGEFKAAQIFVAVLGASNYTYACASWSQSLPDWIESNRRALEFFGGVPRVLIPDNLKSAVNRADRYEAQLNPVYAEFATHYRTAIIPARPYKPKDKAKVEVAVLVVERWVLARLRHHTFFCLAQLNREIARLITGLNDKPFKKLPGTRRSQFEALDQPHLHPLPAQAYEYSHWKQAKVHIDYHIEHERHYYSVPHALVGQRVDVRIGAGVVEIFHERQRIASHARSTRPGGQTTVIAHMPEAHRQHHRWSPGRFLTWAQTIGPSTQALVQHLLENRPHPELGYRACLGLLNLEKGYGKERLEAACLHAVHLGTLTQRSVRALLKKGLDQTPLPDPEEEPPERAPHDNLRGPDYYH